MGDGDSGHLCSGPQHDLPLVCARAGRRSLGASDIFIGVNAVDYSGYPDCRPEYIEAFERMANLATKAGVEGEQTIYDSHPLIPLTKAEIISRGLELGRRLRHDQSAATIPRPTGSACGHCDACLLALEGLRRSRGCADPARLPARAEP